MIEPHLNDHEAKKVTGFVPSEGDAAILRFEGNGLSMRPFVRSGDVVRVSLLRGSTIRLGEILLCYVPGVGAVAHRVMRKVRRGGTELILLKGDAANCLDGPVELEQIIGRVIGVERDTRLVRLDTRFKRWLGLAYGYFRILLRRASRLLRGIRVLLAAMAPSSSEKSY